MAETIPEKIKTAYGLFIDIDCAEGTIIGALMAPADKTVEVAIKYQGVVKEFAFHDFFRRLGFYDGQ